MQIERQTLHYLFSKELYDLPQPVKNPPQDHEVVIICNELNETQKAFLTKIINAVKLDLTTITLINLEETGTCSLFEITKNSAANKVIVFGLKHKDVGLNVEAIFYNILTVSNIQLLFADNLSILAQNIQRKKILWGQLKTLFKL